MRGMVNLLDMRRLYERVGPVNLFDETMAVGYYELHLRDQEQRWVAQEIVHLSTREPGENVRHLGSHHTIGALVLLKGVPQRSFPELNSTVQEFRQGLLHS